MKLIKLPPGILQSNAFLVISNGEAAMIDAGVSYEIVEKELIDNTAVLKYVFLTHSHFDHCHFVDEIRESCDAKVCIHELESEALADSHENLSYYAGQPIVRENPDLTLSEGDVFTVGDETLKIIHSPGHSKGGICISVNGYLFTGDTLFKGAWGRTDFPDGNEKELLASIERILEEFDDNVVVHSGHGAETRIALEKSENLFRHFLK